MYTNLTAYNYILDDITMKQKKKLKCRICGERIATLQCEDCTNVACAICAEDDNNICCSDHPEPEYIEI